MTATNAQPRPELGFYALAGQPDSSRDLIEEVRSAEVMGLGTAFISERYNLKEAATLCGAAGAVTEQIRSHGTPEQCASALRGQLAPVVDAYRT